MQFTTLVMALASALTVSAQAACTDGTQCRCERGGAGLNVATRAVGQSLGGTTEIGNFDNNDFFVSKSDGSKISCSELQTLCDANTPDSSAACK